MCSPCVTTLSAKPTLRIADEPVDVPKKKQTKKMVSFCENPRTEVVVERLDLSFYTATDFARFRQELVEEQQDVCSVQKQALLDKRKRGYNKLMARRNQRCTTTSKSCQHQVRNALSTIALPPQAATATTARQ